MSSPGNYPEDYYIKAWTRFSPYVVGIGLGFVLHLTKKKKIKLNRAFVLLMWCLAFGIGLCVVYGQARKKEKKIFPTFCATFVIKSQDTVGLMMENTPPPTAGSVLYNTFGRSAWAAAMAWLVFACFHGYGGFINDFLSYEAFGPLGKLVKISLPFLPPKLWKTHYFLKGFQRVPPPLPAPASNLRAVHLLSHLFAHSHCKMISWIFCYFCHQCRTTFLRSSSSCSCSPCAWWAPSSWRSGWRSPSSIATRSCWASWPP